MPINKVVYYGKTIIDLSNDSVSADKMLVGTIAHNKSGEVITGAIPIYKGNYIVNDEIPIQNGNTLTI